MKRLEAEGRLKVEKIDGTHTWIDMGNVKKISDLPKILLGATAEKAQSAMKAEAASQAKRFTEHQEREKTGGTTTGKAQEEPEPSECAAEIPRPFSRTREPCRYNCGDPRCDGDGTCAGAAYAVFN